MINRVERLVNKVEGIEGATLLEKFITNMQRERAEVAFYIFTNGSQVFYLGWGRYY